MGVHVFEVMRCAICALVLVMTALPAAAQTERPSGLPEGHSPSGALWRAFAPGWGQIYNRQYYKLPFVYGGIAGLGYGAYHNGRRYVLYRRAALFAQCLEGAPTCRPEWSRYEEEYNSLKRFPEHDIPSATLQNLRDKSRRNRDLFIIGIGLYYGFIVLDAYVSAHLVYFDVSPNLSLRLAPLPGGIRASVYF